METIINAWLSVWLYATAGYQPTLEKAFKINVFRYMGPLKYAILYAKFF